MANDATFDPPAMLDHFAFNVDKDRLEEVVAFYLASLAPLKFEKVLDFPNAIGIGANRRPDLWLLTSDERGPTTKFHIAFTAPDRKTVDAFHAAAVKAGGKSNGEPGVRADYHKSYYTAYVTDPVGNNIEVVDHRPDH